MGGFDGHVRQNTAERYTPATNQWSLIAPMQHQRSDASASALNRKYLRLIVFHGDIWILLPSIYFNQIWHSVAMHIYQQPGILLLCNYLLYDGQIFKYCF